MPATTALSLVALFVAAGALADALLRTDRHAPSNAAIGFVLGTAGVLAIVGMQAP